MKPLFKQYNTRVYTKIIVGIILVIALCLYIYFQAHNFIAGPVITINEPQNGTTVSDSVIKISGIAKNISSLKLNGKKIFTDERGYFSETVGLMKGYNSIELSAEDRVHRETKNILKIVNQ